MASATQGSHNTRGRLSRRIWKAPEGEFFPDAHRHPCAYEAFIPADLARLELTLDGDLAGVISEAEKRIVALRDSSASLAPLERLLLRTESIASSKIEGLQVAPRTLLQVEVGARRAGPEASAVLANVEAMQHAIATATDGPLTLDQIREIHATLLRGVFNEAIAGVIRTSQNWIGGNDYNPCGADYVPPPPELVPALMADLVAFCNSQELPPLVQAAIAHAQFETIHPFADGNGRTGRALIHVLLRRRGLATAYLPPVSVVLANERDRYIERLSDFRNGDSRSWLLEFGVAAARAADLAADYLDQVRALQERWRSQLRTTVSPRADATSWQLIEQLPALPVITTTKAVEATGRSLPAVLSGLEQLVAADVLRPTGDKKRHRVWEAPELIALLDRLANGDA